MGFHRSAIRLIARSAGAWALAGALVFGGLAAAAPAGVFSDLERRLIVQALQRTADGAGAPTTAVDDATLQAMILRQARIETGQRLRPIDVDPLWALQPPVRDLAAEFAAARAEGRLEAWLRALAPADPRYAALLAARPRYAKLVADGGWTALPPGPVLKAGDTHPSVPALRQRLAAEGFAAPAATPEEVFDAPLSAVVERFQTLHGLEIDGVVGPETRRALDVTAAARLAQIDANLERYRWSPAVLPADRVEVDTGLAEATLFERGAPVLTMRVVVGDLKHKTPMFASRLEAVVVNPPWNVPSSIATAEILPKAARDKGYLARNGFRFVDGRLQQRPGPGNSLGRLKFDLPSPFGVYLHDTPGKSAFARRVRALSHGCMRLEKPRELAVALLGPQGWTLPQIDAAIAQMTTRRIGLDKPVPLFVVHRTAFVDADGLHLRPDVYGWDAALTRALAGRTYADAAPGATECAEADLGSLAL